MPCCVISKQGKREQMKYLLPDVSTAAGVMHACKCGAYSALAYIACCFLIDLSAISMANKFAEDFASFTTGTNRHAYSYVKELYKDWYGAGMYVAIDVVFLILILPFAYRVKTCKGYISSVIVFVLIAISTFFRYILYSGYNSNVVQQLDGLAVPSVFVGFVALYGSLHGIFGTFSEQSRNLIFSKRNSSQGLSSSSVTEEYIDKYSLPIFIVSVFLVYIYFENFRTTSNKDTVKNIQNSATTTTSAETIETLISRETEGFSADDKELNTTYARLRELLPTDEMKSLILSERKWIKYKESECNNIHAKGSSGLLESLRCQRRMTQERIVYLKTLLDRALVSD